jgi:predicted GIY-YIG superfamily endonuclease
VTDTQSTPFVNTPEILYRLRAANGDLLYVGITRDFPSRLKQHYADKPWAYEIRSTEQVHIDGTRQQIEAIEKAVIIAEKPRYNKTHNVPVLPATPVEPPDATMFPSRLTLPNFGGDLCHMHYEDGRSPIMFRVGDIVRHDSYKAGYIVTCYYGHDDGVCVQFQHGRLTVPWSSITWVGR